MSDDMLTSGLLAELLCHDGEVITADEWSVGISLMHIRAPDVLLLDSKFRDSHQLRFCKSLRSDGHKAQIPILFLTSDSDESTELAALAAGARGIIVRNGCRRLIRARITAQLAYSRDFALVHRLAHRDELTGLYNRRYFNGQAETEIARHRRQGHSLALALVDVDYFKLYNDHYGHQAGDDCLQSVAQVLVGGTRRPGEFAARYGGEEFVVLLPFCDEIQARRYSEWTLEKMATLALLHPVSLCGPYVSISIGVVTLVPNAETSLRSMLERADQALYEAKRGGRACYRMINV